MILVLFFRVSYATCVIVFTLSTTTATVSGQRTDDRTNGRRGAHVAAVYCVVRLADAKWLRKNLRKLEKENGCLSSNEGFLREKKEHEEGVGEP